MAIKVEKQELAIIYLVGDQLCASLQTYEPAHPHILIPSPGSVDVAFAREFAQAILMACEKANELSEASHV